MATRFPMSPQVGYGNTVAAMARTSRRWPTASAQGAINSPAPAPTMVTPKIRPPGVVTTLMWPPGARSIRARSFSWNGQRSSRNAMRRRAASASVTPTWASSGSVKVTRDSTPASRRADWPSTRLRRRGAAGWSGAWREPPARTAAPYALRRAVGGAQPRVGGDPLWAWPDARLVGRKPVDVRPPRAGDEQVAPLDRLLAVGPTQHPLDLVQAPAGDARDRNALAHAHAIALEPLEHAARAFGILLRQHRAGIEHGDGGAEPAERR